MSDICQDDTDDLDFSATIDGHLGYLELTEIAPLEHGGYECAREFYEVMPFANYVSSRIQAKASKYDIGASPVILLLYCTD